MKHCFMLITNYKNHEKKFHVQFILQLQFPAGYGTALASYIQLLILCYMGHNVRCAVCFFVSWLMSLHFIPLILTERHNLWCIEQHTMVLYANVEAIDPLEIVT